MAGKAPRGEIGARHIVASKGRIAKESKFLKSLRARCIDRGISELFGGREIEDGSGIFEIPKVNKAITEALKLAREEKTPPFLFLDEKDNAVPLIKIAQAQRVIRECQQTIRKFGGEA